MPFSSAAERSEPVTPTRIRWRLGSKRARWAAALAFGAAAIVVGWILCLQVGSSAFASGGLGLNRREWERLHGPAVAKDSAFVFYRDAGGECHVNFLHGDCYYIERTYADSVTASLESARREVSGLIPADSVPVRSYATPEGPVDFNYSATLKSRRFNQSDWGNAKPGEFSMLYYLEGSRVSGFMITTGDYR